MSNLCLTGQNAAILLKDGTPLPIQAIAHSACLPGTLCLTMGPNSAPPAAGQVIECLGVDNQPVLATALDTAALLAATPMWTVGAGLGAQIEPLSTNGNRYQFSVLAFSAL